MATTVRKLIFKRSNQSFEMIVQRLAIYLLCCCLAFVAFVDGQMAAEGQQKDIESMHKYQQLQYQIQQQQQQQYKEQMQQQQQYHFMQQHQQEQHEQNEQHEQDQLLQPISLPLQKQKLQNEQIEQNTNDDEKLQLPQTQMQMLKTGASLVVAADSSAESDDDNDYYASNDSKQIATRRSSNVNGRKRKRRPQSNVESGNAETDGKHYWRGHVQDDAAQSAGNSKEDGNVNPKLRRRKQPAIREPLAALEKEQKLYELRDKQRQREHGGPSTLKSRDKSYRRPYSQSKKEGDSVGSAAPEANSAASSIAAADLKNILKNSGGLSLSEILQQKNLSLDDLLKGKQTALLALQTTAAAPGGASSTDTSSNSNEKTQNFKHLKPARRIPPTYLSGASAEIDSKNSERGANDDATSNKNKLKFPTLHRLKLFGAASRTTAVPLPGYAETAHKKREPINTATITSTSTTTTTTTRLPIYKKRSQQRSTLKPPSLIKAATATGIKASEVEATTKETLLATIPIREQEEDNIKEEGSLDDVQKKMKNELDDFDANLEAVMPEIYETTTDHIVSYVPTSKAAATTHISTRPTTTTTPSSSTTTTTIPTTISPPESTTSTTLNNSSSSRRRKLNGKQRQRTKSKYNVRLNDNNLKSNSIEINDTSRKETTNSYSYENDAAVQNNSTEEDDLENFFEEVSEEARREAEESSAAIEDLPTRRNPYHRNPPSSTTTSSTTEEPLPDMDGIDDRTDLLELIEDRRSGNRLFKVLQQRNMTLDQLIEHRKRGSSQLHLATIVEENARAQFFPGQKVILHDNMDIVTAFENFPHFNVLNLKSVKPDEIKTDSQGSSYFTSIIDIEPTDEVYSGASNNAAAAAAAAAVHSNSQATMQSEDNSKRTDKSLGFFPPWNTLALASLATTTKSNPFYLPQPKLLLDEQNSNELNDEKFFVSNETSASNEQQYKSNKIVNAEDTVEAIENDIARAHDLLDLELSGHAFKRSPAAASLMNKPYSGAGSLYTNMPAGIRSAIVASAAIVLTSIATFLVIFLVCRLKQRKRSKTNYLRTFDSIKNKMPAASTKITTTTLGKTPDKPATNSRCSSVRKSNVEDIINSTKNSNTQLPSVATISSTTNQQMRQCHSSDLLFPRRDSLTSNNTSQPQNQPLIKTCPNSLLYARNGSRRSSYGGDYSCSNGGFSSITGSTNSLALSLRSAQNVSSTKLNTMDPNSPEVQEYLFDTLRKSFN